MSFSTLISGADCGPVNPLAQMVKHAEADRSLQKDRIGPSGAFGSQLRHLPSSSTAGPSAADAAMARQFFEGNAGPSTSPIGHIAPFQAHRPTLAPPLLGLSLSTAGDPSPASFNEAWGRGPTPAAGPNTSEGLNTAWNRASSASPHPTGLIQPLSSFRPLAGVSTPLGGYASAPMMMMRPLGGTAAPQIPSQNWDRQFSQVSEDVKGKGKARLVEIDSESATGIEDAFRQLSTEEQATKQDDFMSDFEKAWKELKSQAQDPSELAKWEAEYQQVLQAQREENFEDYDYDYGSTMRNAWEQNQGRGLNADFTEKAEPQRYELNENGEPTLSDYPFEPANQYLALPGPELLAKAKHALENNGSLSEAALMFEAAIQKGDLGEGGYEAWILLGETRSMDEREDIGLLALRQGVQLARKAGVVGPGMLSLAVSYTNEGWELPATAILYEWLRSRFPDAQLPKLNYNQSLWHARDETTAAYIKIAQDLHAQRKEDPDVQVGLGILYYADLEYDKAKDCFESALWARPQDYLLWNRLGSCLSNNSKPEEALNIYREALRLRPTYTRAIFNVGVACLNMQLYQEAAEHFLTVLATQRTESGGLPRVDTSEGTTEQTWKTLRKTFSLMNREDLVALTDKGDVELFKAHGFEF